MFLGHGQPNRTPEEITSAILVVADGFDNNIKRRGATRMKIMGDAFLSFKSVTDQLEKLQHEGLIEYNADTHSYLTTEKGKQLLLDSP